jgi:hypothetical protein
VDRTAGLTSAEGHSVLLRAIEVGDRHNVLTPARALDELGQDAAAGDVERRVDAVGRERANPLDDALAIGDRLGSGVLNRQTSDVRHAEAPPLDFPILTSRPWRLRSAMLALVAHGARRHS